MGCVWAKLKESHRERQFAERWAALGGPSLVAQHQFHPSRKWKLDWAHPDTLVAIEIHGGTWMRHGRHTSGRGFWGDRIKMNAALRLNWKVFELTSDDLADDRVYAEIVDEIGRRTKEGVARRDLLPFRDVLPNKGHGRRVDCARDMRQNPAEQHDHGMTYG